MILFYKLDIFLWKKTKKKLAAQIYSENKHFQRNFWDFKKSYFYKSPCVITSKKVVEFDGQGGVWLI